MSIDYGPLKNIIGTWKGNKGKDFAPDPNGIEENNFYELLTFEAVGDVKNAESQLLAVVRYTQEVFRKEDEKKIHDQTGYWLWDARAEELIYSITIPRGLCLLAKGSVVNNTAEEYTITANANIDDPNYTIIQTAFMSKQARTTSFTITLRLNNTCLEYEEITLVDIYGKKSFEHKDSNILFKVDNKL